MNSQMNQKSASSLGSSGSTQRSHANFIEALKSIGGQTTKTLTHDVIGGVGRDFVQSLTGSNQSQSSENNFPRESSNNTEQQIREAIWRQERQRELSATPLFSRKEEENKTKIKVIKDELRALAKDLAGMDKQLEKAIEEEITNPGTYHVSFFEKLRRIIINLRKQVNDSANWLEISAERKAAKGSFWGNVKTGGSKFLMSQEHTVATQSG